MSSNKKRHERRSRIRKARQKSLPIPKDLILIIASYYPLVLLATNTNQISKHEWRKIGKQLFNAYCPNKYTYQCLCQRFDVLNTYSTVSQKNSENSFSTSTDNHTYFINNRELLASEHIPNSKFEVVTTYRHFIKFPQLIQILRIPPIVQIACGKSHVIIMTNNGMLLSRGNNSSGQLGLGDLHDRQYLFEQIVCCRSGPDQLQLVCPLPNDIISIHAGGHHSIIITYGQTMLACGDNAFGQLYLPVRYGHYNMFERTTCSPKNKQIYCTGISTELY